MDKHNNVCWLFIAWLLVVWSLPVSIVEAAVFKDISTHWARSDVEYVAGQGIIAGYSDNTFRPDKNVTRAEYIAMINRTLNLKAVLPNTFSDVNEDDWFAADIGKARAAGYISGYSDGTVRPGQSITRQEAAFMIAKVMGIGSGQQDSVSRFKDKKSIGSWAVGAIGGVVAKGYMGGYPDNTFRPTSFIKRAETAVIMRAMSGIKPNTTDLVKVDERADDKQTVYNKAGVYGPVQGTSNIDNDVYINVDGVTLRNQILEGDLTIASSVGQGSVHLSNLIVRGRVNVEGGGANTIVANNTTISELMINKDGVRFLAEGSTVIKQTNVKSSVILEENITGSNGFDRVSILSSAGREDDVELRGSFDNVSVSAPVDLIIGSASRVTTLTIDSSANVRGSGSITTVYVNASGVTIIQHPANTIVVNNITASVGGETIKGTATNSGPTSFYSGYPKTANIGSHYFDLLVKTNRSGYVYYVVLSNGERAPSTTQVRSGKNAYGNITTRQGSTSVNSNTETSLRISGLSTGAVYDVYVVFVDNDGNEQVNPNKLDVTVSSSDYTPPDMYSGYPQKFQVTTTTLEFLIKISENGTAYYVVLPYADTVPSATQVKAGRNGSSVSVPSNLCGSVGLFADTQKSVSVTGLNANTTYALYVIAQDDIGNLQTTVRSLLFTTTSSVGGVISFASSTDTVAESVYKELTVNRTGGGTGDVIVYYCTANGTAYSGYDYSYTTGSLYWASGETASKTITIPIINDNLIEYAETFTVTLSNVTGSGATLGSPSTVTVTILSDDSG